MSITAHQLFDYLAAIGGELDPILENENKTRAKKKAEKLLPKAYDQLGELCDSALLTNIVAHYNNNEKHTARFLADYYIQKQGKALNTSSVEIDSLVQELVKKPTIQYFLSLRPTPKAIASFFFDVVYQTRVAKTFDLRTLPESIEKLVAKPFSDNEKAAIALEHQKTTESIRKVKKVPLDITQLFEKLGTLKSYDTNSQGYQASQALSKLFAEQKQQRRWFTSHSKAIMAVFCGISVVGLAAFMPFAVPLILGLTQAWMITAFSSIAALGLGLLVSAIALGIKDSIDNQMIILADDQPSQGNLRTTDLPNQTISQSTADSTSNNDPSIATFAPNYTTSSANQQPITENTSPPQPEQEALLPKRAASSPTPKLGTSAAMAKAAADFVNSKRRAT